MTPSASLELGKDEIGPLGNIDFFPEHIHPEPVVKRFSQFIGDNKVVLLLPHHKNKGCNHTNL